eukprot:TRINITY_DN5287_c0_g1_i3.p3 TRINITY_DN5287_c0_g1~~TRINITY_DN5287_c0_g1_i3.p3  ORF type:complete len:112 (+),score=8.04 TRINITY_DN5287_c0_g1_i3:72-407(+)
MCIRDRVITKKFWKAKIERMNCKDNTEKLELEKDEEECKAILEREANKLISVIASTSKAHISSIKVLFVIHANKSKHLLDCRLRLVCALASRLCKFEIEGQQVFQRDKRKQ